MEQTTLVYLDSNFYGEIKEVLTTARRKAFQAINFSMVEAYWQSGKSIVEKQAGDERSAYGKGLIKELSEQLTKDFGKGFTVKNLRYMRQFYLNFPIRHALRVELR